MFELETAIENWKQAFRISDAVSPEQSSELEEHLRELIIDLNENGLSQREAFMVAADRLGHPSELEQEYAKVNGAAQWRRRVFWMLSGIIMLKVIASITTLVVTLAATGMAYAGVGSTVVGITISALALFISLGLLAFAFKTSQNPNERLSVSWLVAAGVILLVAPAGTAVGRVALLRVVDHSWFGESAKYLTIGWVACQLCFLALCLVTMYKFNQPAIRVVD